MHHIFIYSLVNGHLDCYHVLSVSDKESACQCWRHGRHKLDSWVGKIPWRRKWKPTPVFLLGNSWTEEPGGLQSRGLQNWTQLKQLSMHAVLTYVGCFSDSYT